MGPLLLYADDLILMSELGRILDITKSHDGAAVRSSQGISAIFRCLMGVKQGCTLSSSLFGLYVDGRERNLLESADIDAYTHGVMGPLLLYADDLILMSESASGLQKQLGALASFCEELQVTVNLSKTKVAECETCESDVCDFVLRMQLWSRGRAARVWGFCPCH